MLEVLKYLVSFIFVCLVVFIFCVTVINGSEMLKHMSFTQFLILNVGCSAALVHPVKKVLFSNEK